LLGVIGSVPDMRSWGQLTCCSNREEEQEEKL
jgi:hypothetical protein